MADVLCVALRNRRVDVVAYTQAPRILRNPLHFLAVRTLPNIVESEPGDRGGPQP